MGKTRVILNHVNVVEHRTNQIDKKINSLMTMVKQEY